MQISCCRYICVLYHTYMRCHQIKKASTYSALDFITPSLCFLYCYNFIETNCPKTHFCLIHFRLCWQNWFRLPKCLSYLSRKIESPRLKRLEKIGKKVGPLDKFWFSKTLSSVWNTSSTLKLWTGSTVTFLGLPVSCSLIPVPNTKRAINIFPRTMSFCLLCSPYSQTRPGKRFGPFCSL